MGDHSHYEQNLIEHRLLWYKTQKVIMLARSQWFCHMICKYAGISFHNAKNTQIQCIGSRRSRSSRKKQLVTFQNNVKRSLYRWNAYIYMVMTQHQTPTTPTPQPSPAQIHCLVSKCWLFSPIFPSQFSAVCTVTTVQVFLLQLCRQFGERALKSTLSLVRLCYSKTVHEKSLI